MNFSSSSLIFNCPKLLDSILYEQKTGDFNQSSPGQPQIFVVVTSAEILAIDRDGPFEVQTGSKQCMYM